MESDDREQRLRSSFGLMMIWTALAIGIIGFLLGALLHTVFAAAGFVLGFTPGESGVATVNIAGHVIVGIMVLIRIVQTYMSPGGLPVEYPSEK